YQAGADLERIPHIQGEGISLSGVVKRFFLVIKIDEDRREVAVKLGLVPAMARLFRQVEGVDIVLGGCRQAAERLIYDPHIIEHVSQPRQVVCLLRAAAELLADQEGFIVLELAMQKPEEFLQGP